MKNLEFKESKTYPPFAANYTGDVKNIETGNILKGCVGSHGYRSVSKKVDGKSIPILVHRIVADAWIPNPDNLPVVNHLDCNKQNNCVTNLEWCTQSHNLKHAANNGLLDTSNRARGEECNLTVYTEQHIRNVCEALQSGKTNKQVAEEYCIGEYYIKNLKNGSSWKHITKEYTFQLRKMTQNKLPDDCVDLVCQKLVEGLRVLDILREINIKYPMLNRYHIYDIKKGSTYKHISCKYGLSDQSSTTSS